MSLSNQAAFCCQHGTFAWPTLTRREICMDKSFILTQNSQFTNSQMVLLKLLCFAHDHLPNSRTCDCTFRTLLLLPFYINTKNIALELISKGLLWSYHSTSNVEIISPHATKPSSEQKKPLDHIIVKLVDKPRYRQAKHQGKAPK